jgi:predicted RNA-binding protein with PUA-like domain
MQYWLMKSEPHVYSIEDLAREGKSGWEGVRNYQARNTMRDLMQVGDEVLFYHSSTEPPGVAGLARISKTGVVDPSQFDAQSDYYDPKSTPDHPRWIMVEIEYVETFQQYLSLAELKNLPELGGMVLLQRGSRLSVQPVSPEHFELICKKAGRSAKKSSKKVQAKPSASKQPLSK